MLTIKILWEERERPPPSVFVAYVSSLLSPAAAERNFLIFHDEEENPLFSEEEEARPGPGNTSKKEGDFRAPPAK